MPGWTHLVRFQAVEDGQIHLGQLVNISQDVGIDSVSKTEIKVFKVKGDIFTGIVTDEMLTVDHLLSPITREQCCYIRCVGLNYRDHAEESGMPLPKDLEMFTKPRTALIGPYPQAIPVPACAQDGTSDYEAELCAVIGKSGRDIPENRALEYVLGYTASNDVSARTLQVATKQWSFSKGLDSSCPIGPVLVSTSVIEDPGRLAIKAIHNSEVVQNSSTSEMIFPIQEQISKLSRGTTLEAGTIVLTGTPSGIGYFSKPRRVLQDGDRIDVQIEKIGTLVNKVVYEAE